MQVATLCSWKSLSELLIGNNSYWHWKPLSGCHNDADIFAEMFMQSSRLDAPPLVKKDLGMDDMRTELSSFTTHAKEHSANHLFFAGHGVETFEGTFPLTVDASTPDDHGHMNLPIEISVEFLKRRFRCEVFQGILVIILACCRERVTSNPVRYPQQLSVQEPVSAGEVILHACECGDEISDSCSEYFSLDGDARSHGTLGTSCARALKLVRYSGGDVMTFLMDILYLAESIARVSRRELLLPVSLHVHPCLSGWASIPRMSKTDCTGVVPDWTLRRCVAELPAAWRSLEPGNVHPQFRDMWISVYEQSNDDRVFHWLQAVLGDRQFCA